MGKAKKRDLSGAFNAHKKGPTSKQGISKQKAAKVLSNPFESRNNKKSKHQVLNRKLKGSTRNVTLSRSLAHEKRKRTLLADFVNSNKANKFADRRFGESNKNLTEEERILERFKKLRSKRSLYDLSDTDGRKAQKKLEFTHLGQSLNVSDEANKEMEEFERMLRDEGLDQDDDDGFEEQFDATKLMEQVKNVGFNEENKKSKKEVMEEVIAKAKMFKMQRQREKEVDETERERLDDLFKGMMQDGMFHMRPTKRQKKEQELQNIMNKMTNKQGSEDQDSEQEDEDDEYERTMRSLVFEARGAASDRKLKPEEQAKRELEKLQEQQRALERRMEGKLSDEEGSDDEDDKAGSRRQRRRRKQKQEKTKDVLFDGEDSESSESEKSEDDEENSSGSDEDEAAEERMLKKEKERAKKVKNRDREIAKRLHMINVAKGELPFVIDVPELHVDFLELVSTYPKATLTDIVDRIRKTNSIHLRAENRGKMKLFLEILLTHLVFLVESNVAAVNEAAVTNEEVNQCMSGIYRVSHDIPELASIVFCDRLSRMQKTLGVHLGNAASGTERGGGDYGCEVTRIAKDGLFKKKKGGHKGVKGQTVLAQEKMEEEAEMEAYGGGLLVSDARCWPSPGDLAFFQAIDAVFPVTDFRHVVVSPAQLLLGQYLVQCPIRGPRDMVACLCTCQTFLDFVRGAQRISPEIVVALEALLLQAFGTELQKKQPQQDEHGSRLLPQLVKIGREGVLVDEFKWLRRGLLSMKRKDLKKVEKLNLKQLGYGRENDEPTVDLCKVILSSLLDLCEQVTEVVKMSPSCDSILDGIQYALGKRSNLSKPTLEIVSNSILASQKTRKPMRLLEVVAKPIVQVNPQFNENYKWTKDGHDPDKYRVEMKKLKKQVHREKKGVVRELRKDAQFIAGERDAAKQKRQQELREERQRNFAFVTQQAGEMNKAVREFGAKGAGSRGVDMRGRRKIKF